MFNIKELVLLFIIVASNILTFSVSKWFYECEENIKERVEFEAVVKEEKEQLNETIKEIKSRPIIELNTSVGHHELVL